MLSLDEGALRFSFPVSGTRTLKYDDSEGYRPHVQKASPSRCGVDILCLTPDGVLWLVEVKDYRRDDVQQDRSGLADVVVDKVLDTLAGLVCIKHSSWEDNDFAKAACQARDIRVVAHVDGLGRWQDDSKHLRKSQTVNAFIADLQVNLHRKLRKVGLRSDVASLQWPRADFPWVVSSRSFDAV